MRFVILLIALMFVSCKSQSDRVENRLYNCLISSLSEKERKRVKPIILGFEQHLIEKGILESSSADSYWNFYKRIADSGTYDVSNDYNFLKKISFLDREEPSENDRLIDCQIEIFNSDEYLNSNQYELKKEIQSLRKHRITPKIISQTTIDYLNVEDFEFDYNRFMTLMFIEDLNSKFK